MGGTVATTPDTNGNATLVLNAGGTFNSFVSSINNANADTLQIGSNSTLTINGNFTVGGYNVSAGVGKLVIAGTTPGTGSLVDTGGTAIFTVGDVPGASPGSAINNSLDMSGLGNFSFTGQQLEVGGNMTTNTGNRANATLTLAGVNNTIKVTSATNGVIIGSGSTSNGGTDVLNLGGGASNVIWTPTLIIGSIKSNGTVQFNTDASGGTLTLRNATGTGRTSISVGMHNGGGTPSAVGKMILDGHSVDILASTLNVGQINGSSTATTTNTLTSTVSFDTGTIDATSITLGLKTGSNGGAPNGVLTMGGGTLIVNSPIGPGSGTFVLGQNGSTGSGATTGTFNLNGGVANVYTNITMGAAGAGGTNASININGGTLSMGDGTTNFSIGSSASKINNFNMPSGTATIQNLGGTGIFASGGNSSSDGGLTMGGGGTLILAGTNNYTGTTNVNSGTVQFGSATPAINSPINMNGGSLAFSPSIGTFQIGGLSGGGGINLADTGSVPVALKISGPGGSYSGQLTGGNGLTLQGTNGTTTQTFTANQAYSGNTTINGGTLQLQNAQLYVSPATPGTTTINGGSLAGSGHVNGAVTLTTGSIVPDAGGTTLALKSLSMTNGTLSFNLNGTTISNITVDNTATLSGGALAFAATNPAPGTYTLLTAQTLNHSGFTLSDVLIGASTFHPFFSGNLLEVTVSGQPSNLVWLGANGSGAWDIATTKNWNNQSTATNPDFFHNLDSVQFDDSSTHNTVNITAAVLPAAVTFTNTGTHNYVVNSSTSNGIGGAATLTMNSSDGTGSATLNTANTYTGNTTVQSGTLIIGSTGSITSANTNITGGALNVNGALASTNISLSNSSALSVSATGSLTGASPTVNVNNTSGAGFTVASGGTIPATLALVNNGTTTFSSSRTIGTLSGTTSSAVLTQSSGVLTVNAGGTYQGAINGASGGLTVAGGTLVLTGANNYGGPTTINSGATLQIDDGNANAGSLAASTAIANSGTLILARTDTPASFANTVTGTGLFVVNNNPTGSSSGMITVTGNNSGFTGSTEVYSGTMVQGSPNALGASSIALYVGQPEPTGLAGGIVTTPGNLVLGFNTQVASFNAISASNASTTPPASTVTIPAGVTLTVNGNFLIGAPNPTGPAGTPPTISYNNVTNFAGGGALVVNGTGNFIVGQPSLNNSPGSKDTTTSDMSQLSSVSVNTTGIFAVGYGANSRGLLSLADNASSGIPSNFVNASELDVGNSLFDNNVGQCVLTLGQGTNVLQANTINIGLGKTSGSITWAVDATTSSSVTIGGTGGGAALASIFISGQNSATSGGGVSNLLLAGHVANVEASTVVIGANIGNTAGGANGAITFDTGTFDAGPVSIGNYTSGTSTTGPTGNLTIGGPSPTTTATGVFNVHGGVTLGNIAVTTAATATASLTINGGTMNVGGRISSPSLFGTTTSTLTLAGNGVLNMSGFSIGGTGAGTSGDNAIANVSLAPNGDDTPTLANLGGAGINGAGLSMNGGGTLILDGFNSYTGGTSVNSGTLQVGKASSFVLYSPLGASSGSVTVGSTLNFGSNSLVNVANPITGGGQINLNGTGKVALTGTGSFTGTTNINAGTLSVQGALNNSGTPGTVAIGGGTLGGSGAVGADVSLNTGSIAPDPDR